MAKVIVLESVKEDIFVCGLCKSIFNSLQIFLDHKSVSCNPVNTVKENPLPTSECIILGDAPPVDSAELAQSEVVVSDTDKILSKPKEHLCETCQKPFRSTKSLLAHLKFHNKKPNQCVVCGRCFNQKPHLHKHISTHKVWPDGLTQTTPKNVDVDLSSYTCTYCDVVLSSYGLYRAHLKTHMGLKKFKCIQNDCNEFFNSIESLLEHVKTAHKNVKYNCFLCSSVFDSLDDIASHQDAHKKLGDKMSQKIEFFKCTQCDAEFRKADKLALHMATENHKKVCIHCKKIFASDKRLRLHLKTHSKNRQFQCNICNNRFLTKKYLSAHLLKHGTRKYMCSVCKLTFKRSDLLKRHLKIHQSKKLYKCPFKDSLDCNKEFSRSDKLKSHIKIHTKYLSINVSPKSRLVQTKKDETDD